MSLQEITLRIIKSVRHDWEHFFYPQTLARAQAYTAVQDNKPHATSASSWNRWHHPFSVSECSNTLLNPTKPYSSWWLECKCKQFLTHTAGSNPVHRWDQARASAPSSWPKETSPGSDDKWSHRLWNTACAGEDRPVQMIRNYFGLQKSTLIPGCFRICTWFRKLVQKRCNGLSISSIVAFKVGGRSF